MIAEVRVRLRGKVDQAKVVQAPRVPRMRGRVLQALMLVMALPAMA